MTQTILTHLDHHAKIRPNAAAYGRKANGTWQVEPWRVYRDEVYRAARALMALGVERGGVVGVLGLNRPEWTTSALAAMAIGAAPAGIYTTNAAPQVAYILRHAAASVAVVENAGQLAKVREVAAELPALRTVVVMDAEGIETGTGVLGVETIEVLCWEDFLARSAAVHAAQLGERMAALEASQLAILIYTSGTTGVPKAVMLSHANLVETARRIIDLFGLRAGDVALSYLPQAHIAEQMISIHVAVMAGAEVRYAEAPEKVADNLGEVRPTIFFAVPRVWERFEAGIRAKLAEAAGTKRRLASWALKIGQQAFARRCRGEVLGPVLAAQYRLADRLVYSKLKARLGFDRIRLCATGAAPLAREILEFFGSLGLDIYEVYGLSESSGPLTWSTPGNLRLGTVGPAFPDVEIRIAEDGEVLARGPNVFLGYLHDAASTAESLADGWLHTGDVGKLDAEGYLTITGRKKEILITSGGKNVAPAGIESQLKQIELVNDCVVLGDGRRFIAALVSLDEDAVERFAAERGLEVSEGHVGGMPANEAPEIIEALEDGIAAVNARLSRVESVRMFRILPRPLSIENEELTPTLKVRRQKVEENWRTLIDKIYTD